MDSRDHRRPPEDSLTVECSSMASRSTSASTPPRGRGPDRRGWGIIAAMLLVFVVGIVSALLGASLETWKWIVSLTIAVAVPLAAIWEKRRRAAA